LAEFFRWNFHLLPQESASGATRIRWPTTHLSQYHPYVFGVRLVILMAQWDVYRLKDDPGYQPENALFQQRLQEFRRPAWCQEVVVTADAAYAAWINLSLIQAMGYGHVTALPLHP
jgi:hypothetical protein